MIPISKHTGQILNTQRVPIIDPLEITLGAEETWSPRLRGRVTIHSDDLDALTDSVIVRLRAAFGSDMSVASLTAWAGGSVANVTALAGGDVSAITAAHTQPLNPFETLQPIAHYTTLYGGDLSAVTAAHGGNVAFLTAVGRQPGGTYLPPDPQHIEARLRVRNISSKSRDGLHDIDLVGEDIALHDYRRMSDTVYVSPHTTLRALTQYVIDVVGGTLATGPDLTITAGAEWAPGQTAWDFLYPVAEANGWSLWADEEGTYRLEPPALNLSPFELDREQNLIEWNLDENPIEDSVVVEYTGGTVKEYDIYSPAGAARTRIETRETAYPGPGAAEEIALRAATRARTATAVATSLYELRPLDRINCTPPGSTVTATVSAVEWNYPAATMQITLRDLT